MSTKEMIMSAASTSLTRRNVLVASAAAGAAGLLPVQLRAAAEDHAIRPFRINVPEADLADLRRRLAATRPTRRRSQTDPRACSWRL
jgi:hypothetical protein